MLDDRTYLRMCVVKQDRLAEMQATLTFSTPGILVLFAKRPHILCEVKAILGFGVCVASREWIAGETSNSWGLYKGEIKRRSALFDLCWGCGLERPWMYCDFWEDCGVRDGV